MTLCRSGSCEKRASGIEPIRELGGPTTVLPAGVNVGDEFHMRRGLGRGGPPRLSAAAAADIEALLGRLRL
jgi:hypothetical protein